jgi:hypothetical protein
VAVPLMARRPAASLTLAIHPGSMYPSWEQKHPKRSGRLHRPSDGITPAKRLMTFDYTTPAELFMAKRKGGSRQQLAYRRFASAAEAIRFAVEEFPPVHTLGVWLQVGDKCFNSHDIQRLYENDDYPLQRESAP